MVLSFWGPHKKTKDITVQINSKKGSEKRFVKLFADEFVRKILQRLSNGIQIEDLFEKGEAKVACTICSKMFLREATLKTHMKNHIICNKCGVGFRKEHELASHRLTVHTSKSEKVVSPEVLIEEKNYYL